MHYSIYVFSLLARRLYWHPAAVAGSTSYLLAETGDVFTDEAGSRLIQE